MPSTPKHRIATLYPEPRKGSLSSDTSRYGVDRKLKGPKMGDMQTKSIIVGIALIVIIGSVMILAFVGAFTNK